MVAGILLMVSAFQLLLSSAKPIPGPPGGGWQVKDQDGATCYEVNFAANFTLKKKKAGNSFQVNVVVPPDAEVDPNIDGCADLALNLKFGKSTLKIGFSENGDSSKPSIKDLSYIQQPEAEPVRFPVQQYISANKPRGNVVTIPSSTDPGSVVRLSDVQIDSVPAVNPVQIKPKPKVDPVPIQPKPLVDPVVAPVVAPVAVQAQDSGQANASPQVNMAGSTAAGGGVAATGGISLIVAGWLKKKLKKLRILDDGHDESSDCDSDEADSDDEKIGLDADN
ncbi:hypothetical protein HDE_09838 [Halotydeus destructor]|nr:hypothetical protein HDE_09838 [Halotydeus destructor]